MQKAQKIVRDILIGLGLICLIVRASILADLLVEGSGKYVTILVCAVICWSLCYKEEKD